MSTIPTRHSAQLCHFTQLTQLPPPSVDKQAYYVNFCIYERCQ